MPHSRSAPQPPSPDHARPSRTFTGVADEMRHLCAQLIDAGIDRTEFLTRCARLTNTTVGCSRTGIWVFMDTAEGRVLRCLAMYDAVRDCVTRVPDETIQVSAYFGALEQTGYVMANDAQTHPATAAFFARSLAKNGVRSLLASSFSVNGHLFGALTCTQVGRETMWKPRQLATLRQIGGPASLALYKTSRFTLNTGFGPFAA